MSGMTKSEIDSYISRQHNQLLKVAKGLTYNNQRNYDPKILLTEAYLHVLKHSEIIADEDTLKRFLIAKMNMESKHDKSGTNLFYSERHLNIDNLQINRQETEYKLSPIDIYLQNEKDTVLKVVAEAYLIKKHNSVEKLRKYFGISKRSAEMYINKMKTKIITYEEV